MLEDDMQLAKLSNRQSLPRRDLTSVVFPGFLVPGGNICKYSTIRYYIPSLWGFEMVSTDSDHLDQLSLNFWDISMPS